MMSLAENLRRFWRIDAMGLAAIAALAAGAYAFQIHPVIRARQSIVTRTADLRANEGKVRELRASAQSVKDQLAAAQRALAQHNVQLRPADQLNQQIARLTDLASEVGVQIDSVEPGAAAAAARYGTISIRLTGWGNYRNCAAFLQHVSGRLQDCSVNKVKLSTQANAAADAAMFSLDLTWYTAPQQLSSTR